MVAVAEQSIQFVAMFSLLIVQHYLCPKLQSDTDILIPSEQERNL